jgi:hypothetical protein
VGDEHHWQGREATHHDPTGSGQQVHVAWAELYMLRAAGNDQGQAGDQGDQTRPEECREIFRVFEDQQCEHGNGHAHRQGNQEYADDETNDAQRRQGHVEGTLASYGKGAILPAGLSV